MHETVNQQKSFMRNKLYFVLCSKLQVFCDALCSDVIEKWTTLLLLVIIKIYITNFKCYYFVFTRKHYVCTVLTR